MFNKPYLLVYRSVSERTPEFVGTWKTGPEAAAWISNHSNPKRVDINVKAGDPTDPFDPNTKWKLGDLVDAKLYKIAVSGVYDTLVEIYNSDSFSATAFKEGTIKMQDLLWDIEW